MIFIVIKKWTHHTEKVISSFSLAGFSFRVLMMDEEADLHGIAENAVSLTVDPANQQKNILFYRLPVPKFWEINTDGHQGYIWDKGVKKGIVHFQDSEKRTANVVEWLNSKEEVILKDYYHPYGFRYKQEQVDIDGTVHFRTFFNATQEAVIIEYPQIGHKLLLENQQETLYQTWQEIFWLHVQQTVTENDVFIMVDREELAYISQFHIKAGRVFLWEENKKVTLLSDLLDTAVSKQSLDYLYPQRTIFKQNILIATNSEWIAQLENLVTSLPDYRFYIVAITEMGGQLLKLKNYQNVVLVPGISYNHYKKLVAKCSIYLDINYDGEIFDAVEQALSAMQLVLTFDETAHHIERITPSNCYKTEEWMAIVQRLNNYIHQADLFYQDLEKQKEFLSSASISDYETIFKGE